MASFGVGAELGQLTTTMSPLSTSGRPPARGRRPPQLRRAIADVTVLLVAAAAVSAGLGGSSGRLSVNTTECLGLKLAAGRPAQNLVRARETEDEDAPCSWHVNAFDPEAIRRRAPLEAPTVSGARRQGKTCDVEVWTIAGDCLRFPEQDLDSRFEDLARTVEQRAGIPKEVIVLMAPDAGDEGDEVLYRGMPAHAEGLRFPGRSARARLALRNVVRPASRRAGRADSEGNSDTDEDTAFVIANEDVETDDEIPEESPAPRSATRSTIGDALKARQEQNKEVDGSSDRKGEGESDTSASNPQLPLQLALVVDDPECLVVRFGGAAHGPRDGLYGLTLVADPGAVRLWPEEAAQDDGEANTNTYLLEFVCDHWVTFLAPRDFVERNLPHSWGLPGSRERPEVNSDHRGVSHMHPWRFRRLRGCGDRVEQGDTPWVAHESLPVRVVVSESLSYWDALWRIYSMEPVAPAHDDYWPGEPAIGAAAARDPEWCFNWFLHAPTRGFTIERVELQGDDSSLPQREFFRFRFQMENGYDHCGPGKAFLINRNRTVRLEAGEETDGHWEGDWQRWLGQTTDLVWTSDSQEDADAEESGEKARLADPIPGAGAQRVTMRVLKRSEARPL